MKPHVSRVTALFLLCQVFLIITHIPLVRVLASIILTGDTDVFTERGAAKMAAGAVGVQLQQVSNVRITFHFGYQDSSIVGYRTLVHKTIFPRFPARIFLHRSEKRDALKF